MKLPLPQSYSRVRIVVLTALVGSIIFGGYLGYLAWTYDSFPEQQKPFNDYARVTSSYFNGTEYAFEIIWTSSSYLPLYAQLTSPSSEGANTPVCDFGLQSVSSGQMIFMPFGISKASGELTDIDLAIAVKPVASGNDFTIVYTIGNITATAGDIMPSSASCQEPAAVM